MSQHIQEVSVEIDLILGPVLVEMTHIKREFCRTIILSSLITGLIEEMRVNTIGVNFSSGVTV